MKTLYLLRHAKAETGTQTMRDENRPLNARGREACTIIGHYMRARQYNPAVAFFSPALRTRETFELVTQAAQLKLEAEAQKRLYLASGEDIIACIQAASDVHNSLLVVGHNPGMHHAAVDLCEKSDSPLYENLMVKYPTGTLTVIEFKIKQWNEIRPQIGYLCDCMSPKELFTASAKASL